MMTNKVTNKLRQTQIFLCLKKNNNNTFQDSIDLNGKELRALGVSYLQLMKRLIWVFDG